MHRILYIQYTNPGGYPPLEHSSRILADCDWQVLFLGTGALGAGDLRLRPHRNTKVRQLRFCKAGWRQKLHYAAFSSWVIFWTLAWRPHWIYASDPFSCPVALLLSFFPGIRVIYHEHDSPIQTQTTGLLIEFMLWARNKLSRRARCCVLPNQMRASRFALQTGAKAVLCVWNCPSREEIAEPRIPLNGKELWILYHGSIVPSRLPLTILEGLARVSESISLRVIGYETLGHPGYIKQFKDRAQHLGIARRIDIVQAVPRSELLKWCERSDLGLMLIPVSRNGHFDINIQAMIGASNKAFDYLACGLPLIVSNLPDWRELYVKPGYARECNPEDPDSIAAALQWFWEHPSELRKMGERGRQRISREWNYEKQFQPVSRLFGISQ